MAPPTPKEPWGLGSTSARPCAWPRPSWGCCSWPERCFLRPRIQEGTAGQIWPYPPSFVWQSCLTKLTNVTNFNIQMSEDIFFKFGINCYASSWFSIFSKYREIWRNSSKLSTNLATCSEKWQQFTNTFFEWTKFPAMLRSDRTGCKICKFCRSRKKLSNKYCF